MASQLCVFNHSPVRLNPYEVAVFVNALNDVLRTAVARTWGFDAVPWVALSERNISDTCMRLHLWETPQDAKDAGAFGVHRTQGPAYTPVAHVFLQPIAQRKEAWTVIASHEVLEMVVNPRVNEYVLRGEVLWAKEVCDPVMGTTIEVNGVKLANFVYPEFFVDGADGPFDHARVLTKPFTLAPTGYASVTSFPVGTPFRRDIYGDIPHETPPAFPPPGRPALDRHQRLRMVCPAA